MSLKILLPLCALILFSLGCAGSNLSDSSSAQVRFEAGMKNLENGNDIKISGFGNFTLREKNARPGRNPKTGEEVIIKERRVVTFKSGLKLKNKLEGYEAKVDEQSG